ncbi:MAG: hypothetical protein K2G14_05665 [Ruminococcus sp.]|nr:hypothetical protein [Ruminococcus sp.]
MSIKKRFIALAVIAGLMSSVSCGAEPENSASGESQTVTESTEAVTETETETEPETVEETTEEETEAETEPETEEEANGEILTNAELLSLINNVFGMMSDGTFETDLQTAKDWDVVDPDAEIDPDTEITAEFLVSASMRATGIVTGDSSMDEIIDCAVEKGVIDDTDLSNIDLSKAVDIVNGAYYAWTHREFETVTDIELADGVIDLNGVIDADECEIDGNTIKLPADFASAITAGTVFIVPDGSDDGTAYKAESVTDNGDGTITINGNLADFTQLDGTIGN